MPDLTESETERPGLPLVVGQQAPRPSLARSAPAAAFVSQLIAARERMPIQRARRTDTPSGAVGAYENGARISEQRMPMGYRKTVLV